MTVMTHEDVIILGETELIVVTSARGSTYSYM